MQYQDGCLMLLLVQSTKRDDWILPKGGWEVDETREAAAARETYEESGVWINLTLELSSFLFFLLLFLIIQDLSSLCHEHTIWKAIGRLGEYIGDFNTNYPKEPSIDSHFYIMKVNSINYLLATSTVLHKLKGKIIIKKTFLANAFSFFYFINAYIFYLTTIKSR